MLGVTLVAPGHNKVIPLEPEFIAPQDGAEKQDCENAAAPQKTCTFYQSPPPCDFGKCGAETTRDRCRARAVFSRSERSEKGQQARRRPGGLNPDPCRSSG